MYNLLIAMLLCVGITFGSASASSSASLGLNFKNMESYPELKVERGDNQSEASSNDSWLKEYQNTDGWSVIYIKDTNPQSSESTSPPDVIGNYQELNKPLVKEVAKENIQKYGYFYQYSVCYDFVLEDKVNRETSNYYVITSSRDLKSSNFAFYIKKVGEGKYELQAIAIRNKWFGEFGDFSIFKLVNYVKNAKEVISKATNEWIGLINRTYSYLGKEKYESLGLKNVLNELDEKKLVQAKETVKYGLDIALSSSGALDLLGSIKAKLLNAIDKPESVVDPKSTPSTPSTSLSRSTSQESIDSSVFSI